MHRFSCTRRQHFNVARRPWILQHARPASTLGAPDGVIINDTVEKASEPTTSAASVVEQGSFFVQGVLPARLAEWDIRSWIYSSQTPSTTSRLKKLFEPTHTHGFRVLNVEPTPKDGGVYVEFGFNPKQTSSQQALKEIEADLRKEIESQGGISSWYGLGKTNIERVRGKPWNEDLSVFPTQILKIEFEGPDVHQELLYELLRPYGRITSLTKPQPVPAGTLRSVTVTYSRIRSAILARNCLYGIGVADNTLGNAGTGSAPTKTRLVFTYERPIKAHFFRDWLSSHPRIVLPVVVFLLGTLTYTIFDPIRSFFVRYKIMGYFNYHDWRMTKFLRKTFYDKAKFSIQSVRSDGDSDAYNPRADASSPPTTGMGEWKERQDAELSLFLYLADAPTTVAVVHGPQGSGKTKMLTEVLKRTGELSSDGAPRKTIEIDCNELYKSGTDPGLISSLAKQTGYWPVFSFLSSMNNLIDLASVGLIGQKAGFSTTVDSQMKEILEVVGGSLKQASEDIAKQRRKREVKEGKKPPKVIPVEATMEQPTISTPQSTNTPATSVPDGTPISNTEKILGAAVSQGVTAVQQSVSHTVSAVQSSVAGAKDDMHGLLAKAGIVGEKLQESLEDMWTGAPARPNAPRAIDDSVSALPVVIIRNFAAKNAGKREDLLNVVSEWAATLVDEKVAHVIVISDNRENMRRLAKALPARPLFSIPLGDADPATSLSFVQSRMKNTSSDQSLTAEDQVWLEKLGGRASDLETLLHKVSNGSTVREAVQDIVARAVGELRKTAFGDDVDEAKDYPWKPEQAWSVLKQLAKDEEISYANVLLEFPFKGDEAALRAMEHAELISIVTVDGLPTTIKPGKPVYRYVFQRLANDTIFRAVQDIAYNNRAIAAEEATITKCENELLTLKTIGLDIGSSFFGGNHATAARANYLLDKMRTSEEKLEACEREIKKLKKVLVHVLETKL